MALTSFLYRLARSAAWGRAVGRAATGHPRALYRRVRNREIMRVVGRWLRK
ncbi:MAG: hypothetical protein GIX03_12160 [Candidatus Eremiobacteraeota bacterium]|nr:hypothetical protein [Candidatus Eremiobacteraeota bacterium]MBC5803718.1 hypothetical protein [Candidatus Eremiobacteraeota bacterium]MBC5822445.1 hypothetical protein [Candidatus Eremiobacteraeota bacterium]